MEQFQALWHAWCTPWNKKDPSTQNISQKVNPKQREWHPGGALCQAISQRLPGRVSLACNIMMKLVVWISLWRWSEKFLSLLSRWSHTSCQIGGQNTEEQVSCFFLDFTTQQQYWQPGRFTLFRCLPLDKWCRENKSISRLALSVIYTSSPLCKQKWRSLSKSTKLLIAMRLQSIGLCNVNTSKCNLGLQAVLLIV